MTHRFKMSVLYQIWETRTSLAIFYIIRIGLVSLFFPTLMMLIAPAGSSVDMGFDGLEISSIIFLFIVGLNSFSETFRVFLQNGLSRKRLVTSFIGSMVIISLGMSIIDALNVLISFKWMNYTTLFSEMYGPAYSSAGGVAISILWSTLVYFRAAMLGYLITVLYYRMNKIATVALSAGVPVFMLIILPLIEEMFTNGVIFNALGRYLIFEWFGLTQFTSAYQGHPWNAILFSMLYSALSLGLAWLLIRKAEIKNKS